MPSQPTQIKIVQQYTTWGVTLFLCISIIAVSLLSAYLWFPAKIHYHIIENHIITASSDHANIQLGIIVPRTGPYQTVKEVSINWIGDINKISSEYVDGYQLRGEITGSQPITARIEYDVILPQGKVAWIAPVSKSQTIPQIGIESNHPLILDTAAQLSDDPYDIYSFLSKRLDYSEENNQETNFSALEALRTGCGACLGHARLMVALCRAADIPAQMMIGAILPDAYFSLPTTHSTAFPGQGHAWVEFYAQGKWSLADPSWGKGFAARLEFKRSDGRHLSYGEYEHFMQVHNELFHWVSRQPNIIDVHLTHLISSDYASTSTESQIMVSKTWDGRWLNVIITMVIVTFVLCKIRDRYFAMRR
jgi:hypothetical protein